MENNETPEHRVLCQDELSRNDSYTEYGNPDVIICGKCQLWRDGIGSNRCVCCWTCGENPALEGSRDCAMCADPKAVPTEGETCEDRDKCCPECGGDRGWTAGPGTDDEFEECETCDGTGREKAVAA